jgi:LuxR family maltose regulon positive regulatory protein
LRAWIETRALLRRGDKDRLSRLARELEEFGQDKEIGWNMLSHAIAFWVTGLFQREGALLIPRLLEAKQQAQQAGDLLASIRVMEWLTFAYLRAGQLHQVERECLAGLALIEQSGGRSMREGYLHLFLARAYYAWNQLEEAVVSVQQTLRIAQDWQQADLLVAGHFDLAWIELARGDLAASYQSLQQAEAMIQQERLAHHAAHPASWVAVVRVQYWLAAGDLDAANHWAKHAAFFPETWDPEHKEAVLMLARIYLLRQQYAQALEILDNFSQQLNRPGNILNTSDFLALHVMALHYTGKREQAARTGARLLATTMPEGNIRVYLDAGDPMKQVLLTWLSASQESEPSPPPASLSRPYVLRLLATFEEEEQRRSSVRGTSPADLRMLRAQVEQTKAKLDQASSALLLNQETSPILLEPLSAQEKRVLRLLVAGQTYAEMAKILIVSPNTIKTQISSIYRKLDVGRRAEAIARAQQLHLL